MENLKDWELYNKVEDSFLCDATHDGAMIIEYNNKSVTAYNHPFKRIAKEIDIKDKDLKIINLVNEIKNEFNIIFTTISL